jgi:hypothetical protein
MSPRKAGSGLHTDAALAVEELWAAHLAGAPRTVPMRSLRAARARGLCGVAPKNLDRWLGSLAAKVPFQVTAARRISPFAHADVEAVLSTGEQRWFELKSQLTKGFDDVTQADFARDQTDYLARLVGTDSVFAAHVGGGLDAWLRRPPAYFRHWTSPVDLLLADLSGLTTRSARIANGVTNRAELDDYIDSKYLLQVTKGGARFTSYGDLAPIRFLRSGGVPNRVQPINPVGKGLWIVEPGQSRPWFSYHLYNRTTPIGRHKLHARSLLGATWTTS